MKAAIYARKSTDNEAGVQRQVDLARDFATSKGWTVDMAHVYTDNDISGATFQRPGLDAFMTAAMSTPRPFDVLVMMDASRLGRDMAETLPLQLRIIKAGVSIWHYQDGQELKLDTPTQKLVASVANYSHEDFRYQIKLKTTAALRKKFSQGHAIGMAPYGYVNVRVNPGSSEAYTERQIQPDEARVVTRIFDLVAAGYGVRRIARDLTAEGVTAPRGKSWAATTIRSLVDNEFYLGIERRAGVVQERPALQIITKVAWDAAHARIERTRATWTGYRRPDGRLGGRPESGLIGRYLLSGFLRCGCCGAALTIVTRVSQLGKVRRYWGCSARLKQGHPCSSKGLIPYDPLEEAILGALEPARVEDALVQATTATLYPGDVASWEHQAADDRAQAAQEAQRTRQTVANLTEAIKCGGGDVRALVEALRQAQRDQDVAGARLEALDALAVAPEDRLAQLREDMDALEGFLSTLQADAVTASRKVLRRILSSPITVSPAYDAHGRLLGWNYAGEAQFNTLLDEPLTGLLARVPGAHSPRASGYSGTRRIPPLTLRGQIAA